MTIKINSEDQRKSRKNSPVIDGIDSSNHYDGYWVSLKQHRENLKEVVNRNFKNKYWLLEACLSIKAQSIIEGVTLPFCLILIGDPSSYKSTILYIIGSLPDCYRTDSFTPKSFVSHAANLSRTKLDTIDLLPKIKNKTLITPELTPLFTAKDENLIENIGILTRILDGKGYQNDSGVHGKRGYEGDYYFTWIGAVVEIPHNVWKILGNLGSKMYFLRLPKDLRTEEEKQYEMIKNLREQSYDVKVDETKNQINSFWKLILQFPNQTESKKIIWDESNDDYNTLEKISILAQTLSKLRGTIKTWNTVNSGGSNYNYEIPIIEEPTRAFQSLYNLARGHAILYGRNYVTEEDLWVVIAVALSSASKERVELFRLLIENQGELNTNQFIEKGSVSRDTALKNMKQLVILDLVEETQEHSTTKPVTKVKLKDYFKWFLTEEFQRYRKAIRTQGEFF